MKNIILRNIIENVEKVIVGKRECIELVLNALICKGHVLIEDVPGVGKTSLVSALAKSVSCSFKRIQFTPDIMPSDITGFSIYNQKKGEFEYRQGSIMSQFILADEINRTSPKTQSSLLEAMEEKQVTIDGETYPLPEPFIVFATQNPIEYLGTYPLPEAQLDRFFMKISMGYPSFIDENKMLMYFKHENPLKLLQPVADASDILNMQEDVKNVYVDNALNEYIVSIVQETRRNESVALGASPRGTLNLYKASQALAFYNGREYVTPDDIQRAVPHVLVHRIALTQEAKFKKITAESVIKEVLKNINVPVFG